MDAPILHFDRYNRTETQTPPFGAAVWLEITRGRARQTIRAVKGPVFLVGAAADCDLVVCDAAFPEVYAYLLVQNDNVTVRRVGDAPELLINGDPTETSELAAGDRLEFGPFELTVHFQITTQITPPPFTFTPMAIGQA